jgi:hypothetical protein
LKSIARVAKEFRWLRLQPADQTRQDF